MFKKILIPTKNEAWCVGAPCALRTGGAQPQAERLFNGSPRLGGQH
jgi:hypothetical protein